jgi:hypothetical protein
MMKVITFVLVACALAAPAHGQQGQLVLQGDVRLVQQAQSTQIRGFSVVLLLGEQSGSMMPPKGLSPSAQRAIADIKEFLPYKSYTVLDTQWVAGSWHSSSKGRISSLDNMSLDFQVDTFTGGAKFRLGSGSNPLLENSFALKPGETVVVGTSRVVASRPQGDSAMIVLLTAVAAEK